MHRFYAPANAFHERLVELGENEAHHLRDVLRGVVGDEVNVFDGQGKEYSCRVQAISKRSATLEILTAVEPESPESPLRLTLAAALLKGDKFDLVVKKCVELGVAEVVPIVADRCEVRRGDTSKRTERWRKLALDASRQCGRAMLMHVNEPADFGPFIESSTKAGKCVLFSERSGKPLDTLTAAPELTAFIGPEGGWSDDELAAAEECGADIITLGGRILRAETASIAIAAILQSRFGDFN